MTWATIATVAAGALGAAAAVQTVGQQVPPRADDPIVVTAPRDDIVVTGERPTLRGGLWRFARTGTMHFGDGGSERLSLPFRFTLCLPDGGLEATLRRAAGERSALPGGPHCGKLRLRVGGGRITGGRSCTVTGPLPTNTLLDISGRYDAHRLQLNYLNETLHDGLERGGGPGWNPARPRGDRWQVTATRSGDCTPAPALDQKTMEEATISLFDPAATG